MQKKSITVMAILAVAITLTYGFIQFNDDPYSDRAPVVRTNNSGTTADTITPVGFPYPTAFNFNYAGIGGMNAGTVGAMWFNGKYYFNRWNSTYIYRYNDNGPGGGPGTLFDSLTYVGNCRDLTTDGTFLYGGPASTVLYRLNPNTGATLKTFTLTGGSTRAIAWDPNRKGFWNTNFSGGIFFHDTTGVLRRTITSTLSGKYGMGWDSSSTPGQAFLWVWSQDFSIPTDTTNLLTKINITTGAVVNTYVININGVGIAGGAEVVAKGNQLLMLCNYQNYALVGYKLKDLAPAGYFNDFESYTVGQRLACQDSLNWTTWSISPCNTTEDPLISSAQSFSPTKSVVITQNNDLVKRYGNDTNGVHEVTFKFYIPTGKAGYWNTLANFAGSSSQWGMECYFDAASTGRILGGSSTPVPFAYTQGSWQTVKLLVNLDVDSAKILINGTIVHKWRWTAGASGTAVPKKISASDFFGATATDEMYVDNFSYMPGANWITGVSQNGNTVPVEYALSQNYPNPFNPTTKINFALPKSGLVTMKIYDILGKEVATLVNEVKNAGTYTVDFNASNLTSGVYFYKVSVNGFSEVKKMLLLK